MDILDVGLTIKEFRMEWTIKYTPNDITFWAPLLDSDLPIQKACAFELFIAWGHESVVKAYDKWSDCQKRKNQIIDDYLAKKEQFDKNFYDEYDDEHYYVSYGTGLRKPMSREYIREAKFRDYLDDSEYRTCQMTWISYFNTHVGLTGVKDQ